MSAQHTTASSSKYSRTPDTFKVLLKKLVQSPDDFTSEDVAECFEHLVISGQRDEQGHVKGATEAQIGGFLTSLTLSGLDSDPKVISACAQVLRAHSVQVDGLLNLKERDEKAEENLQTEEEERKKESEYKGLVDIVGTGGDGHDTFNVSTTAAIVAAGVPGVNVAKHGSKAATSSSGSADLLLSLGCELTFPPSSLPTLLEKSTFAFLFAPHYHPALAHLAPIRRQLNFRTVFNILGPLINPAKPQRMVLGVAKKELGQTFIEALKLLGVERALVVCGKEGLDEISCEGETWTWELRNGEITESSIHPTTDFGLATHPIVSVRGSTPELNSLTFRALLTPCAATPPHLSNPADPVSSPSMDTIRDYVLLNAAALLKVSGAAADYKEGVDLARESMDSGSALKAFESFKEASREAMHGKKDAPEDDGGVAAKGGEVQAWHHKKEKK